MTRPSTAVWRHAAASEVYRDPQIDYEALMVRRNAPRWIRMPRSAASTRRTRRSRGQRLLDRRAANQPKLGDRAQDIET